MVRFHNTAMNTTKANACGASASCAAAAILISLRTLNGLLGVLLFVVVLIIIRLALLVWARAS